MKHVCGIGNPGPDYFRFRRFFKLTTNTSCSDIDFVIRRVDQAWDYFKPYGGIYDVGRNDFDFMQQVEKDEMNVTDLFEMLGDLFTNGTLGHFEEEVC